MTTTQATDRFYRMVDKVNQPRTAEDTMIVANWLDRTEYWPGKTIVELVQIVDEIFCDDEFFAILEEAM